MHERRDAMMYLIATLSILAAVIIQIAWYATRKEEELVKMQWDQRSWDRLQKEMDYNLDRMWKLAGGRPKN